MCRNGSLIRLFSLKAPPQQQREVSQEWGPNTGMGCAKKLGSAAHVGEKQKRIPNRVTPAQRFPSKTFPGRTHVGDPSDI